MTCLHEAAEVGRSAICVIDDSKVLRSFCTDCDQFVEGVPLLDRAGRVTVNSWVLMGPLYEQES